MKINHNIFWIGLSACTVALLFIIGLLPQFTHTQTNDNDTAQLTLLRDKAEKGDAQAQLDLGVAFYRGKFGMPTNYAEAVKWFHKAAEQENADAQYNAGVCYANARGVEKNWTEAVKWYRKAADQEIGRASCRERV